MARYTLTIRTEVEDLFAELSPAPAPRRPLFSPLAPMPRPEDFDADAERCRRKFAALVTEAKGLRRDTRNRASYRKAVRAARAPEERTEANAARRQVLQTETPVARAYRLQRMRDWRKRQKENAMRLTLVLCALFLFAGCASNVEPPPAPAPRPVLCCETYADTATEDVSSITCSDKVESTGDGGCTINETPGDLVP